MHFIYPTKNLFFFRILSVSLEKESKQKSEVLQPYSVKLKFTFDQVLESKNKFAV